MHERKIDEKSFHLSSYLQLYFVPSFANQSKDNSIFGENFYAFIRRCTAAAPKRKQPTRRNALHIISAPIHFPFYSSNVRWGDILCETKNDSPNKYETPFTHSRDQPQKVKRRSANKQTNKRTRKREKTKE